ncbi:MAG: hypothetical protein KAR12_03275 [Methylococcales bacterium]|nr:hypothetical protein [Methylococcales bacterium]
MKNSFIMFTIFTVFVALSSDKTRAHGHSDTKTKLYNQCILDHMQQAKLNMVADEFKRICFESYSYRSSLLKEQQLYNGCLLTYLKEVESETSAEEIIKSCRSRYLH